MAAGDAPDVSPAAELTFRVEPLQAGLPLDAAT